MMKYLFAIFTNRCPRCRKGKMFCTSSAYRRHFMKMNERCPVCKQRSEIEVGFYYGSGYVSYALTVALSVASFIAWWVFVGISTEDNRVLWWILFNAVLLIVLQPWLMRLARIIWLSFFVKYNPNWKNEPPEETDRIIEDQMETVH
ncbi:MAG: DUF983 domain-containing protein [Ferruginibacter sp.]|nr:DUF983 domain-containing protein [Ferruginibacter sp.]